MYKAQNLFEMASNDNVRCLQINFVEISIDRPTRCAYNTQTHIHKHTHIPTSIYYKKQLADSKNQQESVDEDE